MSKSFWSIVLVILFSLNLFGCHSPKSNVKSPSDLVKHMGSSTAALVVKHGDRVHVYCSAVWLSPTAIVTANHCVEAAYTMWVKEHSNDDKDSEDIEIPDDLSGFKMYYVVQDEVEGVGEETTAIHLAKVVNRDKDHDIAMVRAEGKVIPPHEYANIASTMPAVGEHVYIVGHVKGLYWSFVEGLVSSYRENMPIKWVKGPFVQISGPVWYGNSGGGAFDRDGNLIGIASFLARAPETSMFIHASAVTDLFQIYKDVTK